MVGHHLLTQLTNSAAEWAGWPEWTLPPPHRRTPPALFVCSSWARALLWLTTQFCGPSGQGLLGSQTWKFQHYPLSTDWIQTLILRQDDSKCGQRLGSDKLLRPGSHYLSPTYIVGPTTNYHLLNRILQRWGAVEAIGNVLHYPGSGGAAKWYEGSGWRAA